MDELERRLSDFAAQNVFSGKGSLSVALVLTRSARKENFPLNIEEFVTAKGGQVRGLGKAAVQNILNDYGVTRVLAEEGGRTSRGSLDKMRSYVAFLNQLKKEGLIDLDRIEAWWIGQVQMFFASEPLRMRVDHSKSLTSLIRDVIDGAFSRQRECPGMMVAGAVMQHLVGAKLELLLPEIDILHNGFSVADAPTGRKGDFVVGDTVIHVTTAPTESLIRKCRENLAANFNPVVITTDTGVGGAQALAKTVNIADRIDVLDICQFLTTNIIEWSDFSRDKRPLSINELVKIYNQIIDSCETDPSLKISLE